MSAAEPLVRRGEPADFHALGPIYVNTDGPSLEFLVSLAARPSTGVWLVLVADRIVGAAWFMLAADVCELVDLRIDYDHRRQGLADQLLK